MLSLPQALEDLALSLPRMADIGWAGATLATVYRDEMHHQPPLIQHRAIVSKWDHATIRKYLVEVIREMQRDAQRILHETHKLSDDDFAYDGWGTFAPGHAAIVKTNWDARPQSPTWSAMATVIETVRYASAAMGARS